MFGFATGKSLIRDLHARVRFKKWCKHAYAAMDDVGAVRCIWEFRSYRLDGVCFGLVIRMLVVLLLGDFLVIVRKFGLEFSV
jgi:hypothetical protein